VALWHRKKEEAITLHHSSIFLYFGLSGKCPKIFLHQEIFVCLGLKQFGGNLGTILKF